MVKKSVFVLGILVILMCQVFAEPVPYSAWGANESGFMIIHNTDVLDAYVIYNVPEFDREKPLQVDYLLSVMEGFRPVKIDLDEILILPHKGLCTVILCRDGKPIAAMQVEI